MSTKKAVATKKEEPKNEKAEKAKKGKDKDEVQAEAKSNGDSKKSAKADVEEKKPAKKSEEAPAKAEKAEAKPAKAAKGSTSAKVYQQASSYSVGELIFHPVWKVEGTVVEVGKTTDGNTKIVVDFPDFGMKRLIAEHQAKA